jgi:hypothetical protein
MNSQLNPPSYPDARIDQVLEALRTTEPPAGLEQRIAARLAHAAEARKQSVLSLPGLSYSPFTGAKFYAGAAFALLIALTTLTVVHRRPAANTAQTDFHAHTTLVTQDRASNSNLQPAGLQSRPNTLTRTTTLAAERISSPRPSSAAADPDQIAMAETLAPSRAAPPLPLTAQEHLILAATRPGQPIQLAELDLARAPNLRAATEAREQANIQRYVKGLLAPFAVADALQPNTLAEPRESSTAAFAPQPPTSSTN